MMQYSKTNDIAQLFQRKKINNIQ